MANTKVNIITKSTPLRCSVVFYSKFPALDFLSLGIGAMVVGGINLQFSRLSFLSIFHT